MRPRFLPLSLVPIFLAFIVGACASLMPQTFNQKLLVGYSTVTEIRVQTTNLLTGKKITPDDAENVQKQADTAREALDVARGLKASNPTAADAKLDATRTVLVALQTYLASKATP